MNDDKKPLDAELDTPENHESSDTPETAETPDENPLKFEDSEAESVIEERPELDLPKQAEPARQAKRGFPILAFLAFVLALAASGLSAWLFYISLNPPEQPEPWRDAIKQIEHNLDFLKTNQEQTQTQSLQRFQTIESEFKLLSESGQSWQDDFSRLDIRINGLKTNDDKIRTALMQLAELKETGDTSQAILEIDFLLRMAVLRVQLFQDRDMAIRSLEMANQHIAQLDDPRYSQVRIQIAEEINALKSVQPVDYSQWIANFHHIYQSAENWPLTSQLQAENLAEPAEETDQPLSSWARIKAQTLSLIAVRKLDAKPVELPENWQSIQRELTQLQLKALQVSFMKADTASVQLLSKQLISQIENNFDPSLTDIQQSIEALKDLGNIELQPALPDIGESLQQFRNVVSRLESGVVEQDS